jgi:CheY-like chemotaxis protein
MLKILFNKLIPYHIKQTPLVVALTAHAVFGDREKCMTAGMNDYLTKPIDIKILSMTLNKWLS